MEMAAACSSLLIQIKMHQFYLVSFSRFRPRLYKFFVGFDPRRRSKCVVGARQDRVPMRSVTVDITRSGFFFFSISLSLVSTFQMSWMGRRLYFGGVEFAIVGKSTRLQ